MQQYMLVSHVKVNKSFFSQKKENFMYVLLRWIAFALVIMLTAWIIPGITVENFWAALIVAVVLGIINAFIKPALQLITLPINILTLGIFGLILNALLLMFAGWVSPGFEVDGFLSAFIGSIVISLLSLGINLIDKQNA